MPVTYPYPRPSVTCDVVAFTMRSDDLAVLLVRRKGEPFKGSWALPGGFVDENEALERAAARELVEETGVAGAKLEQLAAFGDPRRDPRGHTITVAYMTFFMAAPPITAGDDAAEVAWQPFRALEIGKTRDVPPPRTRGRTERPPAARRSSRPPPPAIRLAFDHAAIIERAYRRLCRHLDEPLRDVAAFDLVPQRFTLAELRRLYEVVLGRSISPLKIRRHLVDRGLVVAVNRSAGVKPKTQLYRWNRR